jgi:hydroxymethylpyrimidine pyrophosphatase-like HAD family hydrolase
LAYFQIVGADVDGTLTTHDALVPDLVDVLAESRGAGVQIVLLTGRIASELFADLPTIGEHADVLVVENGAVVIIDGNSELLTEPVDLALDEALTARNIPFRRGQVLVAVDGQHCAAVADTIALLGLDCQIIRNRNALMVLPTGVTKGSGLGAALARLNRSPHNAIAVGDAENDIPMLMEAELGVAVANAISSVKHKADLVLNKPNAAGVLELLRGPLLSGAERRCPPRRWITVGQLSDGLPASLPGSQARIVVTGPAGSGKSHLTGLMAEQWIVAGYSVLVVDPEGDHTELKALDHVLSVDCGRYLPEPTEILEMFRPTVSLVLDMSVLSNEQKSSYLARLRPVIEAFREGHGFPHWIIYDEAHLLGKEEVARWERRGGYVLASFAPVGLPGHELTDSDFLIEMNCTTRGGRKLNPAREAIITTGGQRTTFTVAARRTGHIRHRHKYGQSFLPVTRRFYFHTAQHDPIPAAANMAEFCSALDQLSPDALAFHLERGDFSRWIGQTIADNELASEVEAWEDELAAHRAAELEHIRQQIVYAISARYRASDGRSSQS